MSATEIPTEAEWQQGLPELADQLTPWFAREWVDDVEVEYRSFGIATPISGDALARMKRAAA